jgi:hypothetical protein
VNRCTRETHVILAFGEGELLLVLLLLEVKWITHGHVTVCARSVPHNNTHPGSFIQANNHLIRTVHQQIKNEIKYLKTEPTIRYDHIDTKITKIGAKTTKLRLFRRFPIGN